MSEGKFEEWAIVELMGHRKFAGRVSEAPIGNGALPEREEDEDVKPYAGDSDEDLA